MLTDPNEEFRIPAWVSESMLGEEHPSIANGEDLIHSTRTEWFREALGPNSLADSANRVSFLHTRTLLADEHARERIGVSSS